jgi:DNA-binding response OmpR family regulator
MARDRVLIIDDELLMVKSTTMALKYAGFDARGAHDGKEGLRVAVEWLPDVILLDIMMPDMEGWEVMDKLKEDERTRQIPVVILTAKEYSDGRILARRRGAADYLAKPFELDELETLVRRHTRADEADYE